MTASPPIPAPTEDVDSRPYWDFLRRHDMHLQQCSACARRRFPVAPACPYCAHPNATWQPVQGTGSVYSFIVIHRTFDPAFDGEVPYAVATVDLDDGGRMAVRMDGTSSVGARVRAVYVDHSGWTEVRFTEETP